VLSVEFGRRVVIVDSSNELGGDSDVPHSFLGEARRMQVPRVEAQQCVPVMDIAARLRFC
jgi:stage III sporulation protein SpoIIIAA